MTHNSCADRDLAGTKRVLVVDSDRHFTGHVASLLAEHGYEVAVAADAEEAHRIAGRLPPDVALVEVDGEASPGVALIGRLRKARPGPLCVLLTRSPDAEPAARAVGEGAYDALRKPVGRVDLLAALERYFERIRLEREKLALQRCLRNTQAELNECNARLRSVVRSTRRLTACRLLGELAPTLLEEFAGNLGVRGGSFYVRQEDRFVLARSLDPGHAPEAIELPFEKNAPFGRAVAQGKPLLISNMGRGSDLAPSGWGGYRDGSLAVYPLDDADGKTIGLISLHNKIPSPLSARDLAFGEILSSVAREALQAMDSAQRLHDSQVRACQVERMDAIGRLAGGIAHDFNNQLTVVRGYCDLLQGSLGGDGPASGLVEEIRKAADRSAALTGQLLAFSRNQVFYPRVLNVNQSLADLADPLARMIGERIQLRICPGEDLGCVLVDPGQLEQAVMNLVINARDAMPDGGRIAVETANVDLDEAWAAAHPGGSPGPHVMLAVADTGTGMDEATVKRVFEPFFTTKDCGKGRGLGLALVHGFVKQSGGAIDVDSRLGVGTVVRVYLPRVDHAGQPLPRAAMRSADRDGSETILVAEDEATVRSVVVRVLRRRGYEVLDAAGAAEALAVGLRDPRRIDLLITDVVMPGLSGPGLAERLKQARPDIRVLYISGYSDIVLVEQGLRADGEGAEVLRKPFSPADLAGQVRRVLDLPRERVCPGP